MAETSVLVVLVATNGAQWLPECIKSIKAQTHTPLDVVAIDNASSDGSRKILEKAFGSVTSLERRVGFGRAITAGLKAAGQKAADADTFLFLHDDAAMQDNTVAALAEALSFEGVGIVGAKLVEWDDPTILQEVGLSIDRYARTFDPLERGELDQGQHDRVKETMWVSSACMLVKREVVQRVGLFDLRFVAFREDLDLCWRARLAGFRVALCGGTAVRHVAASLRDRREGWGRGRTRYFIERNLLASLFKNYSRARLVLVLPVAVALAVLNAILLAFTGRRREAAQVLEALRWNLVHLPSTLRARVRAQRNRTTSDAEAMRHAMRGAHRVRQMAERAFERIAGDPALGLEEAEGLAGPEEQPRRRVRDLVRAHPVAAGWIAVGVLYLIASRGLFHAGALAGADMPSFPSGPTGFFREFFSGWRSAGLGSASPAPPALFLCGALSVITFGSTWLAQRLLVLLLIPIAASGASRLATRLGCGALGRRVAGFAYALSPIAIAALGRGRLAELVLVAVAPGVLVPIVRAAGLAEWNGPRDLTLPALGLAAAAAFSPYAIVFTAGAGIVVALGLAVTGSADRVPRTLAATFVVAGAAMVLLLPWSMELFRSGSPLGLGGIITGAKMADLVRLTPDGFRAFPILLAAAYPVAAAAGIAVAPSERASAARVLGVAATISLGLAWAVGRGVPWIAPRSALPLTLTAVAFAVLAAFLFEGIRPALSQRSFGLLQLGLGVVSVALIAAAGAGGAWLVRGQRPGLVSVTDFAPTFLQADREQFGEFRVLWLAGKATGVRSELTGPTGDDMTSYAARRAGPGPGALDRVLAGIASGRVDAAGRQLAPFGVRYVMARSGTDATLLDALNRQADLRFVQRFKGMQVFSNDAWLPIGASVGAQGWVVASGATLRNAPAAVAAAEGNPQTGTGFARLDPSFFAGPIREGAKRVLFSMSYDADWRLVLPTAGKRLPPARSFGWAMAFPATTGDAAIFWQGQGGYRLQLGGELAIFLAAAFMVSRRVARERGERD